MDRRTFSLGATALAGLVWTRSGRAAPDADADAALQAMLGRHFEEYLALSPEAAAGIDEDGRHAAARAKLDDRSQAGKARQAAAARRWKGELATIDAAALSPAIRRDRDIAAFTYDRYADLLGRYGFVDTNLRPNPYVVNQMAGSYYWLPESFGRTRIANQADVDAYLSRLAAFGPAIDQETERVRADAATGVVPPDFILARTIEQIAALRDTPARDSTILREPFAAARGKDFRLDEAKAAALLDTTVRLALDRQIAALRALQPRARHDGGVWRQPDGEAWYRAALHANVTVDMPPEEMHRLGLAQVREISAEIDRMLRAQGMTKGTLRARLNALDADPRFVQPDDDAGREKILAYARDHLAKVHPLLPRAFRTLPTTEIEVRRVPVAIEAGAPGAYYNGGPADGSRPGIISINLKNTAEWPLWRLTTLVHHEGVPGHHLQTAVFRTVASRQPPYKRMARFSAYSEGWGLYGERVADEIGVYTDDPFGRIGYLQSALWRATRIVVDTGLHHKRWSREQAIRWMVENAGEQEESTAREIDRYCVLPGQACAFKFGQIRILAARERARGRLGAIFDVRAFHDLILLAGAMPIPVLEALVDQWDGAPPTA